LGTCNNTLLGTWWEKKSNKISRKVKMCRFGSGKWFFCCIVGQFAEAGNKPQQSCTPATEEYDKYDLSADPCF
jgi:hypothetical protein